MEAAKHDKRTVFVRGIAFSTGPQDFEAFFSELGPVRTSFLVRDKGQTGHKGFGFVQFALPEDAQKAAEQLHNKEFQGRKLKVEPAVKRAPLNDRKKRKFGDIDSAVQSEAAAAETTGAAPKATLHEAHPAPAASAAAPSKPSTVRVSSKVSARASKKARKLNDGPKPAANPKQRLVRTVAVGNLDSKTKQEAVTLAQAAGKVESIEDPPTELDISHARLKQDGCTGTVIFIVYDSVKTALAAVAKLHGQPLPTKKSAKCQKTKQDVSVSPLLWARQVSGEGLHLKKWRLIIRNLSFQAKPAEVKAALEAGGNSVWDLSLPKSPEGALKGFGFATFMTRGHAESAIKTTNGQVVAGRQVVLDWAMAKARFTDAAAQTPDEGAGAEAAQLAEAVPVPDTPAGLQDAAMLDEEEGAEIADPVAEQKMVKNVLESLLRDEAPEKPQAAPTATSSATAQVAKPAGGVDEAGTASKQPSVEVGEGSKAQPAKLEKKSKDTAGDGQQAGRQDSRHTVFVRALPPDVSQDQLHLAFKKFGKLRACRLVMNKESQQPKGTAFVEFWDASAAQAAAAACQKAREGGGGEIMVGGRTVEVDLALSQHDARNLASGGRAPTGAGKDNRNLYLGKEGTIEEGSAAWESMSATDRSKRKRAAEEKNTKLRSPNFSVSRTRLSVRNIPFTMQEKQLKQLFIAAVKEHASKAEPRVKQAKILRDPERIEPADGLPRSRGLGFVEFTQHDHAICALRQLNNNPAPFSRDKRPIVEFALESAQAVRKMATKQAWQKTQTQGKGGGQQGKQQGKQQGEAAAGSQGPTAQQETAAPASKSRKERQLAKKRPAQQDPEVQDKKKKARSNAEPANQSRKQIVARSSQQQAGKHVGIKAKRPPQQVSGPSKHPVERKRQADDALDQLAARPARSPKGVQERTKATKGRQAKGEKGDKLDDMISSYKAKYFSGQVQAPAASKQPKSPAAGISRWFE